MGTGSISLKDAFMDDHREMTRGFVELRECLENGEWHLAKGLAAEIDRVAGPHIEFEESLYYPRLAPMIGATAIRHMYREHSVGLAVIREILSAGHAIPEASVLADFADRCGRMLEHAHSCGVLVTHLTDLPQDEERELLKRLLKMRYDGRLWTEVGD